MHCAAALALLAAALLLVPATTVTAPGCHGVACRAKAVSKNKHAGADTHIAPARDTQGKSTEAKHAGADTHITPARDTQDKSTEAKHAGADTHIAPAHDTLDTSQAQEKRPTQSDEDILNAFVLLQHGIATPTPTPTVTMPAQPTTFDGAICSAFPAACRNAGIC